jgi:putative transposase
MTHYQRNLPHWHPAGKTVFLTWRLDGSLPINVLQSLRAKKERSAGRQFLEADRHLDNALFGPLWLKDPRIAKVVVKSLLKGANELKQYALHSFVVMANHVHILIDPIVPVARITSGIKGATARRANQILERGGKFWQDESFDHWVRNAAEFERLRTYIERNPVTAGLVLSPEDWPWSSASPRVL